MNRIVTISLLVLFSFIIIPAHAQTISGVVTGADDGQTLPGVSVQIKGTTQGTATDLDGKYILNVPGKSSVLIFSFIGYTTVEVPVGDRTVINIALRPEAQKLDEVVVTALGVKREKREIGYSSEKMNTDEIVRSGTTNVLGAIAGRSAGVQISQGDGVEGGSTRIVIRGNNNLARNNQPLIVVDNVPLDNNPGLDNIGRGVDWETASPTSTPSTLKTIPC